VYTAASVARTHAMIPCVVPRACSQAGQKLERGLGAGRGSVPASSARWKVSWGDPKRRTPVHGKAPTEKVVSGAPH